MGIRENSGREKDGRVLMMPGDTEKTLRQPQKVREETAPALYPGLFLLDETPEILPRICLTKSTGRNFFAKHAFLQGNTIKGLDWSLP